MPTRTSKSGSELFIVDNSDSDWKVHKYLHDWCQLSEQIDIATGYFEIGSLLALDGEWQKTDKIRILMGDEITKRTNKAFVDGLAEITQRLDDSIESEKEKNDFLTGVPAIVEAIRSGKIECRVYRKDKFHAKAYITHARLEVVGSSALVGSSNFTYPGLTENIELNVQITGGQVNVLQEWYEEQWDVAEDVTPDIMKVMERHTNEFTPFEVYARSLQEHFRSHEVSSTDWERNHSKMFPVLASYQTDAYHGLLKRAERYGGAFLCDGVGLGKTFVGLMLIERLVVHEKKRVVLFVPKAAREAVWQSKVRKYIPEVLGGFMSFRVFNHTDLQRSNTELVRELEQMRNQADVIIIDEAHHFRNTGIRGDEDGERKSRYWRMFDLCEDKQLYMLTATPVNNRLTDFQHMTELFSRKETGYFNDKGTLGIHSLAGHIRKLEKEIEKAAFTKERALGGDPAEDGELIDLIEAEDVLRNDDLFEELVVQRSRAFVKKSMGLDDGEILFPESKPPKVVPYSVKQTYGKLLTMVEEAFHKQKPLFSLAMYFPWEGYYKGDPADLENPEMAMVTGRQKQVVQLIRTGFLKRFESSVCAFEASCRVLMKKLIAFYMVHADAKLDKERLEKWLIRNADITGYSREDSLVLINEELSSMALEEEDVVEPEFFEHASAKKLNASDFDISGLLADTLSDLDTIADFLKELVQFEPKQDKKLQGLIQLIKGNLTGLGDVVLQRHKMLIFSEFKDTARYLERELKKAGFEDIVEIDSDKSADDRESIIKRFSPYYNDTSSPELKKNKQKEIRILISTDVLSEGLNLQDATRLINYDLHWNPVRLMQRIGRTDRRLDPEIEKQMIEDNPELESVRGKTQYYNFLPPDELNGLLTLWKTVTRKTLKISKTFGIENGKLLRPDDDYDILKDFTLQCEGTETKAEEMKLELERLYKENPELEEQLNALPNRVFSGKKTIKSTAKGVFFCYARPGRDVVTGDWTEEAGDVKWYLYLLKTGDILEDANAIYAAVKCVPDSPRKCDQDKASLIEIRKKMDKHLNKTYLRKVQAPIGVEPVLRAWMELN
ncbi:MAG: DEAD/DEAH box helicase family protein [Planctomycetes bacterium]|nr:DEAD/DEAH box helicase family protein [Planctomycetota bacterium]